MRHYLYLEDRRIAYVCGCFKGGVFTLRAAKTAELTKAGDVQEAVAFLRSAGLAGKRVIAAVGGSETVLREMRLPAASAKITRGMIRNEIVYFGERLRPLRWIWISWSGRVGERSSISWRMPWSWNGWRSGCCP